MVKNSHKPLSVMGGLKKHGYYIPGYCAKNSFKVKTFKKLVFKELECVCSTANLDNLNLSESFYDIF